LERSSINTKCGPAENKSPARHIFGEKYDHFNGAKVPADIVIITENNVTPRSKWRQGRVERIITGRDEIARAAELRIYNLNKMTTTTLKRALQRLVPLEV